MRTVTLLVLAGLLLAGCSAAPAKPSDAPQADFSDLNLAPTATTGIIRGVVVDNAVRPLAKVTVLLRGTPPATMTTKDDGAFGFDGLAPGSYFLSFHKTGYNDVQQSVDVVAGVDKPPIAKVQLQPDGKPSPYNVAYTLDGIVECGSSYIALCGAAHDGVVIVCVTTSGPPVNTPVCLPQPTNDAYSAYMAIDGGTPGYIQTEMVWDSTQALGDNMYYALRYADKATYDNGMYNGGFNSVTGPSPLLDNVTGEKLDKAKVGNGTGLVFSIFSGDASNGAVPLGLGPGATFEQRYTFYVHAFYGYMPPDGWRFTTDGPPPPPQ
jgi:hypothetical protein